MKKQESYGVQKPGYGGMDTKNKPESAGKGGKVGGN
jgi:hypothetical protein